MAEVVEANMVVVGSRVIVAVLEPMMVLVMVCGMRGDIGTVYTKNDRQ